MTGTETVPARVTTVTGGGTPTDATVKVETISPAAGRRKGITWMLAIWGAGLLTLPIPLIHFVTIPTALLVGPLVGFLVFRTFAGGRDLTGVEGTCPACDAPLPFVPRTSLQKHHELQCAKCSAQLQLSVENA